MTKIANGEAHGDDHFHPLDPLSVVEVELAGALAKHHILKDLNQESVIITSAALVEPHKQQVLAYLDSPPHQRSRPDRVCEINAVSSPSGINYILTIDFPRDDPTHPTIRLPAEVLPTGTHLLISPEEIDLAEEIVRTDVHVQRLCKDVGVSVDQIACDGWAIGFDPDLSFAAPGRLQQCLMYARPEPHANLYAHPLDFVPVVDTITRKVVRIDFPARRITSDPTSPNDQPDVRMSSGTTAPNHIKAGTYVKDAIEKGLDKETVDKALEASGRDRIMPPLTRFEFLPDLRTSTTRLVNGEDSLGSSSGCGCKTNGNGPVTNGSNSDSLGLSRPALKPLHVIQPDGPSFQLKGNQLDWQNWRLHIGFNYREGLILNTISYKDEGVYRPMFYRLSLVEMVVPYGAPEAPHNSKFAFDVGEYGLGNLANSLSLGCDCLGEIRYLDAINISHSGKSLVVKNAICIHEEDAGLLWKHTDLRPGGRSYSVRSRKLVISFICTIANYDYMFYWNFFQDGSISLDTKLSGILNLHVLAEGESPSGFGTEVAPRIIAQHHAHTFSLRIDPMIDGIKNSVVTTDIVALPNPTGSLENYLGNGFKAQKKVLKTTTEGAQDYDHARDRSWTIINPNKLHYATKEPIGYRIACKDLPKLIAKQDSMVATRAPFTKHDLFVTPYSPDQFYPAGKYVPGTTQAPEDGIQNWMKGDKKIDNEDIVVYLTYGTNHLPTPEQFPIMSAEVLTVSLKPSGFFKTNPSLDIVPAKDLMSRDAHANGKVHVNGNGA